MGRHHAKDGVWKQCPCPTGSECVKKHGTWSWRVRVGQNPVSGEEIRRHGSGHPTRKAAVEARAAAIATHVANPGGVDDRGMTVGQWLDSWLQQMKGRERTTWAGYETNVRLIWKPTIGGIRLKELTHQHVDDALAWASRRDPDERPTSGNSRSQFARHGKWVETRSVTTLERYRATLRRALNVAITAGLIDINVAAGEMNSLREPRSAKTARIASSDKTLWTFDETRRFLGGIAHHPWALLYYCYAYTGARRGEWLGMRWQNMSDAGDQVQVIPTAVGGRGLVPCYLCSRGHVGIELKDRPKSDRSVRWLPLNQVLARSLAEHRVQQRLRVVHDGFYLDHGLIFPAEDGGPLAPKKVTDEFKGLVEEVGVPQLSGLHALRHMVVTGMLEAGEPVEIVAKMTGHDVPTLRRHYAHLMPDTAKRAAQRYADAINGKVETPASRMAALLG